MARQVLFNGTVLVRAGGATKVDATAFQNLGLGGVGTVGVVGEGDGGEPDALYYFNTPQAMVETFRSGPLADVADILFRPMNDPRVPGGAQQVIAVKVNQATQATKTFTKSATNELVITSKDWGAHTNKITTEISDSGGGKVIEFSFEDGLNKIVETSPVLGGTAEFTLLYTGAGSAAACTITATSLTTTVTGATGENLDLSFATYATLQELINAINVAAGGVYTAVAVTTNPYGFFTAVNFDYVAGVDIKTAAASFYAKLYRMISWVNANSGLVSAARSGTPGGDAAPDATSGPIPLTGGARGISSNSDWQDGLDLLGQVRVNQVVPLISYDLTADGYGSTATFASVSAAADSHAAYYSSTAGKNERECYLGMEGTKTTVLAQAGTLQSLHTVITSQIITRANAASELVQFAEWGYAALLAGARAGSLLGEPLTYKTLRVSGLTQDASWNPVDDGADLILGGVTFAFPVPNQGYRNDRVVTTFTKADNAAYVEESVVQGWKNIAYNLRTQLENIYTGVRGLPATVSGVKDSAITLLEKYRQEGQIVDSYYPDGTVDRAYRDLNVVLDGDTARLSVIISPVQGINFQLHTLFLVPAVIAA